MPLSALFDTPAVKSPFISSGNLADEERLVHFPATTRVHAGLLNAMVERGQDLVVVTPSDRAEFLHLYALEALFGPKVDGRNAVFLLSSNTEFRERFRQLAPTSMRPPHDKSPYAREETPIANVTKDGSPATVTKNLNYPDKPARFLFSYTSTRIPSDDVGDRVRCVIYDGSVKYDEERLLRLWKWKQRNDVPAIVYFTSNPTSDLVEKLRGRAFLWTWPPRLLSAVVESDRDSGHEWLGTDEEVSPTTHRAQVVARREQNRVSGLSIDVHTCGDGDLLTALKRANDRRARFEYLARELDADILKRGQQLVRYTLGSFRELLTPLDVADFHARRTTISSRLAQLDRFAGRIASDPKANPATGTFRDVVSALEELEELWDSVPASDKKQGVLVDNLLYGALDRGDSISVVTATESQQQALKTFLQSEHAALYRDLGDDLSIHDTHSIRSADPTDHVVLYGALRWGDRDLLRTDVATDAIVLAYPIEMGLLHSQVDALEDSFESIADTMFWNVINNLTRIATDEPADVERVNIDLPEYEEPSTSDLGDDISVDEAEGEDLGEIVRGYETDYEDSEDFDPTEYETSSTQQTTTSGGRTETDCLDVHFDDGLSMYLRKDTEVYTVREGHDKLFKKNASRLKEHDVVVHLKDTDEMRDQLYALIRERGDVGLYYYANLWKVNLEAALEKTGDDLDDFVEKMEQQGLNKNRGTYERWYEMEVHRTRSKKSFWAIADAYDLDGVKENFSLVWNAVQEMETIYSRLKKALRQTALRSAADGTLDDVMLSESPDIRLSDFEIGKYLFRLNVQSIEEGVEAKSSQIGRLRGF
ncbi:DrmE family protein [Natrinema sp. 1APR25-10V2]|uniref:DrmE family protein n=1 Tax=Natrinema sp. 1APR25-10V2 TaxID=2951081 RepID=UPI0028750601|nr:DrmE family protein [Natrinema sp. 1APR25-10V2]MDS0474363.1 DrmE family protein [Natrinema sp. 1APR25-10V2]